MNIPARIQECLPDYPWITDTGRDCVISPDCDGFLCGLFMSAFFDWKIKGFYDGKALVVRRGVNHKECVFLDMEICRPDVKSVGQHMLYFNVHRPPQEAVRDGFSDCLSPNNLRRYDYEHNFMRKYPLGTIHLLMALASDGDRNITAAPGGMAPLLYVDGTFKNLFNYPENCLDWLGFLDSQNNALSPFFHGAYPFSKLMSLLNDFFALLNGMIYKDSNGKQRPDKLQMTDKKGNIANIVSDAVVPAKRTQVENFLQAVGCLTGWRYQPEKWSWENYDVHSLEKGSCKPGLARFQELAAKKPLSWAIISRNSIEYTLDARRLF